MVDEALDLLLDQEGLEVDPLNRMEGNTPLHTAVNYASLKDAVHGLHIVELLIDAGSDPRFVYTLSPLYLCNDLHVMAILMVNDD